MKENRSWKQLKWWQYQTFQMYDHLTTFFGIAIVALFLYNQKTSQQFIIMLAISLAIVLKITYSKEIFHDTNKEKPLTLQQYRFLQLLVYFPIFALGLIAIISFCLIGLISKIVFAISLVLIALCIWFLLSLKINEQDLVNENDLNNEE